MPTQHDSLNKIITELFYTDGYVVIESPYKYLSIHTAFHFDTLPEFDNKLNHYVSSSGVKHYVCILTEEEYVALNGITLFKLQDNVLMPVINETKIYNLYKNPLVDSRFVSKMTNQQIDELIALYNQNPINQCKLQILNTLDGLLIVTQFGDIIYKGLSINAT